MALIKCAECGKEFSDKANACPNCSYPLKKEKAKKKRKKILFQTKQKSFKIFKIIIMVCIVSFILLSIKELYQHFESEKELKQKLIREQEIISKYIGGNTTIIENKIWKTKHKEYYETYVFNGDYTCEYYKSGYTFEFKGETLPSFSERKKYYYKVEEIGKNGLIITVFEINFDTEYINTIETLEYFPPKTSGNFYFNETMYGDNNNIFLPDDKPQYEKINE